MTDDWWPTPLAHMAGEDPWAHDDVVVAEVKSFDEKPRAGHRKIFAVLVPIDQIKAVEAALVNLNHDVSASGPHPLYMKSGRSNPSSG